MKFKILEEFFQLITLYYIGATEELKMTISSAEEKDPEYIKIFSPARASTPKRRSRKSLFYEGYTNCYRDPNRLAERNKKHNTEQFVKSSKQQNQNFETNESLSTELERLSISSKTNNYNESSRALVLVPPRRPSSSEISLNRIKCMLIEVESILNQKYELPPMVDIQYLDNASAYKLQFETEMKIFEYQKHEKIQKKLTDFCMQPPLTSLDLSIIKDLIDMFQNSNGSPDPCEQILRIILNTAQTFPFCNV